MYTFSVGAMFRNEAHALVEWIEHYLFHGADHIYLIDDDSTDNSCEVIQKYVDSGVVTLYKAQWSRYYGRQHHMYNHYFKPIVKESKWLLICDLDEFVWSPHSVNIVDFLKLVPDIAQIQFQQVVFGSNGHVTQPASIVGGFTRRSREIPTENPGARKYIINTAFEFTSLNVHYATFENKDLMETAFTCYGPEWLRMNHYCCQSRDFWMQKCSRGDSDFYRTRTMEDMAAVDLNDMEDLDLLNQNRQMMIEKGLL